MRPEPAGFAFWNETEPGREKLENVRGLGNQKFAGFQKWRRERRMLQRRIFEEFHDPRTPKFRVARHVHVIRAAIFERQPYEFAPPLNRWLVVKLITHGGPPAIGR